MVTRWMNQFQHWDDRIFVQLFRNSRSRVLERLFFKTLSRSADGLWYALGGLLWLALEPMTARPFLIAGLAAFALELPLYKLVKDTIRRPRPYKRLGGVRRLMVPPDEFSFPSGHTAGAFLVGLLLTAAHPWMALPAFTWAFGVGLSRVVLGVHYPGDVLAGMVLGLSCAFLALRMAVG